jgi:hypothetical protein
MNERRATQRQRIFKAGTIEFEGAGIHCIIRNVSTMGAGLEVANPVGIPHEITLNILTQHLSRRCYVVWRKQQRLGVIFEGLISSSLHHGDACAEPLRGCTLNFLLLRLAYRADGINMTRLEHPTASTL